jgi:PilZ domain-containing protein
VVVVGGEERIASAPFLHFGACVRTLASRVTGNSDEKRDRERVEILGELHGEIMVFQPLSIKEISRGGCLVETAFPLHLNSLHDLRLTLGDQSVVLKGRVAHCRISDVDQEIVHYRSGMEFIEPSERIRSVIEEFVEAIKAGRRLV